MPPELMCDKPARAGKRDEGTGRDEENVFFLSQERNKEPVCDVKDC